jgi:hypothetical protein
MLSAKIGKESRKSEVGDPGTEDYARFLKDITEFGNKS